jgi:hypothetical protein
VYSIRLADHLAQNQDDEEDEKQHGGYEQEPQTRIVRSLIDHDAGHVFYFLQWRRMLGDRWFKDLSITGVTYFSLSRLLPALWTEERVLAERNSTGGTTASDFGI